MASADTAMDLVEDMAMALMELIAEDPRMADLVPDLVDLTTDSIAAMVDLVDSKMDSIVEMVDSEDHE